METQPFHGQDHHDERGFSRAGSCFHKPQRASAFVPDRFRPSLALYHLLHTNYIFAFGAYATQACIYVYGGARFIADSAATCTPKTGTLERLITAAHGSLD